MKNKIKPITAYTVTDRDGNLDWRYVAPYEHMAIGAFLGQANDAHWERYKEEGHRVVKVVISPFERKKPKDNRMAIATSINTRKLEEVE